MRIRPSIQLAVGFLVMYCVVWIGTVMIVAPDDFDMEETFSTVANSKPLVFGVMAGSVFGILVVSAFGWWRPVLHDDRPVRGWLRRTPLIVLGIILVSTDYANLGNLDGAVLAWSLAMAVFVGFSEELTFRGLNIVALRKTPLPEFKVWWISCLLFGLLHLPNALIGSPLASTAIPQIFVAAMTGSAFYLVRRATGSILPAMALHGLWDLSIFTGDSALPAIIKALCSAALLVALIATRHLAFDDDAEPATVAAT